MRKKNLKVYLCVDINNPKTNKKETCYLTKWDLESLLNYTSYHNDAHELLNGLPLKEADLIKDNLTEPLSYNTFYFKSKKKDNRFGVVYKSKADLVYVNYQELSELFNEKKLYLSDDNILDDFYLTESKRILELIAQLVIDDHEIMDEINYNFNVRYDSDRNTGYIEFENCRAWQRIGLLKENVALALKYICKDPKKKLILASNMRKIVNKPLVSYSEINTRKIDLLRSTYRRKTDYRFIKRNIEKNLDTFFGIKKEDENSVKQVTVIPSVYVEPIDEREEALKQHINDALSKESKDYAINELSKYELLKQIEDPEELYTFSDLDDIIRDKSK